MQEGKKIAIHYKSGGFTERWVNYCENNSVPYKLVNCYKNNIINDLKDCKGLMWRWQHDDYRDRLFAYKLLSALIHMNIKIFPDFWNNLYYDDKLGQKYLLEAINAPVIPSFIFYDKQTAIKEFKLFELPIVFKLRAGAGSQNVKLINSYNEGYKIINRAFGRGFKYTDKLNAFYDRIEKFKRNKSISNFKKIMIPVYRTFFRKKNELMMPKEKGYVYFQKYLPNNSFDTRLIIIGPRCFGLRRYNRKNDFRASGSGLTEYDPQLIDKRCIKIAFNVAKKLNTKSLALDFLFDDNNKPVIVEMSYAFPTGEFTDKCKGFWDNNLNFHKGHYNVQHLMVEDFIKEIEQ
jgi:glutathione synthase/RimK-type ligase-like ATP-grasp enzyme